MTRRLLACALLVLAVTACQQQAPPLVQPDRIESFCQEKEPRGTAVDSILSSVADQIESRPYPGDAILRSQIQSYGGVIGHWKSQPLYMPGTANALGIAGNYIDVTDVYIDNQLSADGQSRLIYVTVKTAKGTRNLVLRAFDTQNVCVEGERLN